MVMVMVLLAHDHPAVRAWVRDALAQAPDIEFVAEVSVAEEVWCLTQQICWDVVLIASRLPGALSSIDIVKREQEVRSSMRMLVLGTPDHDGLLCRLWRAGVVGCIPEGTPSEADRLIKEIRVFHLEEFFYERCRTLFNRFFAENKALTLKRTATGLLSTAISVIGWFLSMAYVVVAVVRQAVTVGDIALYTQAISATQQQLRTLLGSISALYSDVLFVHNLFEYLEIPAGNPHAGKQWTEPVYEIEFRNVSFTYPKSPRPSLENISFRIKVGESLALVGRNGAGKTTIIKLLCKIYEPQQGQILINGKDIAEYSAVSIQECIAILFQDFGFYYLAAKENIGIGRVDEIEDAHNIQQAALQSGAHDFIQELPQQYETLLGKWFDGGTELSGGEWQKVALARAFFRRGCIMVLDEPTSALDAEAESEVFAELLRHKVEQITILISHRFSTVRMVDHILVIQDGRCAEAGSHSDLMQLDGQYARLFRLQAHNYQIVREGEDS